MSNLKILESGRAKTAYQFVASVRDFDITGLSEEYQTLLGETIFQNNQEEKESIGKKYKSHVRKLPMYIKNNGLGSAIAFALSKKSDVGWDLLYQQISYWLSQERTFMVTIDRQEQDGSTKIYQLGSGDEEGINYKKDLTAFIIELHSNEYRALTIEVLAFLTWLRRFVDGLIEGEPDDNP